MKYLVDTNVLSELCKAAPHPSVAAWFADRPATELFVSVLTFGEIRKGIEMLPQSPRKRALNDWLDRDLPMFFTGRTLAVDAAVANTWGKMLAGAARTMPGIDGLLAATALEHELTLVTRNVRDFSGLPVQLLDPWTAASTSRLSPAEHPNRRPSYRR